MKANNSRTVSDTKLHDDLRSHYLTLLKSALIGDLASGDQFEEIGFPTALLPTPLFRWLSGQPYRIVRRADLRRRREGRDYPQGGMTMIGRLRLDQLEKAAVDILRRDIPGDFLEAGVWRGGASILLRGVLKIYGVRDRVVWAADSFQGVPKPDSSYSADFGNLLWTQKALVVSLKDVRANFSRFGLLDNQVKFLPGWFRDTLPTAPVDKLALLRLDGDLYESTMDALNALYHKVSQGGYIIVDDYGAIKACRRAVDDFRTAYHITTPMVPIDWTGVYWQREDSAR